MSDSYSELYKGLKRVTLITKLAETELNLKRIFSSDDFKKISHNANIDIITRKEIDFKKFILSNNQYSKLNENLINLINNAPDSLSKEEKKTYLKRIKDLAVIKESLYKSLKEEFYNAN